MRVVLLLALAACSPAWAGGWVASDNYCDPGEAPDVFVANIPGVSVWTTYQGIAALSFGTVACNSGTCQANWISDTPDHPVIAQNLYRLADGRFEQIGQSWVKHGFFASSLSACFDDCIPGDNDHLGVHCSDPYSAFLNGLQLQLGPRSEINPFTGEFPFPPTDMGQTNSPLDKRLQARVQDVDPALNPGAAYFLEAQYVLADDGQPFNNVSYRPVEFIPLSGGFYDAEVLGETVVRFSALHAWFEADPATLLTTASAKGDGRFTIASRVTDLGNGQWHYEYAVHNLNSHRAARSFALELPFGVNLSNIGFHDVDYHSGEPYDGTDWAHNAGGSGALRWETATYASNPDANALRWGTLYNFRFDADAPPVQGSATLGLFRPAQPGQPTTLSAMVLAPRLCDGDGICDPHETCENCRADCADQQGGGGCCGDGSCDAGETPCNCAWDCGAPATGEVSCNDHVDTDCDGLTDCEDSDCCFDLLCVGHDMDGDLYGACDCNDDDGTVWVLPGEARDLEFADATSMDWAPPLNLGAVSVSYEVVRSANPLNFTTSVTCLPDPDSWDTICDDPVLPPPDALFCYLIRAVNDCPAGQGPLGRNSDNQPRPTSACP